MLAKRIGSKVEPGVRHNEGREGSPMNQFRIRKTPTVSVDVVGSGEMNAAVLLDVREANEWEAGHAPEARWVPLGSLEARRFELPMNKRIVVICRSGARSKQATDALLEWGFEAANFEGGMQSWAERGLPVVTNDGTDGTVL